MTEQRPSKDLLTEQQIRFLLADAKFSIERGRALDSQLVSAWALEQLCEIALAHRAAHEPPVMQIEGECPNCSQWVVLRSDRDEVSEGASQPPSASLDDRMLRLPASRWSIDVCFPRGEPAGVLAFNAKRLDTMEQCECFSMAAAVQWLEGRLPEIPPDTMPPDPGPDPTKVAYDEWIAATVECPSCLGQGCEPDYTDDGRCVAGASCKRCEGAGRLTRAELAATKGEIHE